jgi:hypothetical protein
MAKCPVCEKQISGLMARQKMYRHLLGVHGWSPDNASEEAMKAPVFVSEANA